MVAKIMRRLDSGYILEESQVRIDRLGDRWRGIEDKFLTQVTERQKLLSTEMGKMIYKVGF